METTKKTVKRKRKPKNLAQSILLSQERDNLTTQQACEEFIINALAEASCRTVAKLNLVNEGIRSEAKWARAWAPIEEKLFQAFKKIVEKENDFFRIAHIDKLKLEYEILIFLGKKNIGKTTEIYRLMDETIERGKKFIYIRYSKNELEKAQEAFNNDSFSPVRMILDRHVWKFFPTDEIRNKLKQLGMDENFQVNLQFCKKYCIAHVGYAYEFCYCQSYTGGQYEDFELIFYDECLTYDPRNTMNEKHLNNGAAFLSSISRNKPNLKVFLFGNLQGTNNLILDFYGIDRDDKFRYIARGGENEGCRILFINGGELYKGFEAQNRAARHAGGQYAAKLMGNEYLVTTTELIEPKIFNIFKHYCYFEYGDLLFHLKHYTIKGRSLMAVKVTEYRGVEKFDTPIYTSSQLQAIKHTHLTYNPVADVFLEKLSLCIWFKEIKYFNEYSMKMCHGVVMENPLELEIFGAEKRKSGLEKS